MAGEEWEVGECEFPRRGKQWHLGADGPKHSQQHPLITPQKGAEALRAKGSERLERQSIYSL